MARPNNAAAISGYVQGLREAKAAFQAMPAIMQEHLNDATELTLQEIVRHAKIRVQASPSIRTRSLLNAIGWTLNRKNGRGKAGIANVTTTISNPTLGAVGKTKIKVKGILVPGRGGSALRSMGAKLIRPSRYAHLVEFGARHMRAEPFMIPATETQAQPYLERCRGAGQKMERDVAKIGMAGSTGLL